MMSVKFYEVVEISNCPLSKLPEIQICCQKAVRDKDKHRRTEGEWAEGEDEGGRFNMLNLP